MKNLNCSEHSTSIIVKSIFHVHPVKDAPSYANYSPNITALIEQRTLLLPRNANLLKTTQSSAPPSDRPARYSGQASKDLLQDTLQRPDATPQPVTSPCCGQNCGSGHITGRCNFRRMKILKFSLFWWNFNRFSLDEETSRLANYSHSSVCLRLGSKQNHPTYGTLITHPAIGNGREDDIDLG